MTFKQNPKRPYNGLTIVLSNPSRFDIDNKKLLSATGGSLLTDCLGAFGVDRWAAEVRLKEDSPLLPNTRAMLLLGEEAMHWGVQATRDNSLGELRGTPLFFANSIHSIASFLPQEAADIGNHESRLNPLLNSEDDDDNDTLPTIAEKRRHGKTARKNWAFWLKADCEKVSHILHDTIPVEPTPTYIIYPEPKWLINYLLTHKNERLFFDCETDADLNITCFSFSFGMADIIVVPLIRFNYLQAYRETWRILQALSIAIRDNTLVAHNGSAFDYLILSHFYKIPIYKVEDTMLMQHRWRPEVEKSLGHCTSIHTWQPFHKDEGNFSYNNPSAEQSLWKYCGKDTYTMILIYESLKKKAAATIGLQESFDQVNASIRPYLISTIQGIRYNEEEVKKSIAINDRLMMQYIRLVEFFVGKEAMKVVKGASKKPMCNSNSQCIRYFHDLLQYPTCGPKSKITGKPSLGKKNMYMLALKVENPIINLCLAYREVLKETGYLNFTPWKL